MPNPEIEQQGERIKFYDTDPLENKPDSSKRFGAKLEKPNEFSVEELELILIDLRDYCLRTLNPVQLHIFYPGQTKTLTEVELTATSSMVKEREENFFRLNAVYMKFSDSVIMLKPLGSRTTEQQNQSKESPRNA